MANENDFPREQLRLDYEGIRKKSARRRLGCLIAAIGVFLSCGPAGFGAAWILGKLFRDVGLDGHPYSATVRGMQELIIRLFSWVIISVIGTILSIVIGVCADNRTQDKRDER